ncbi:MAG: EF-hand domain-containing protein [Limisphaerales bacterium]
MTNLLTWAALAGATMLTTAAAFADDGPRPKGPRDEQARAAMLERFDANKDGRLDETERAAAREAMKEQAAERRQEALAKFDKDGDGKLSDDEKAAAKEAMKERAGERRQELLAKFDKDGDGKMSDDEKAAAREAMKERGQRKPQPGN